MKSVLTCHIIGWSRTGPPIGRVGVGDPALIGRHGHIVAQCNNFVRLTSSPTILSSLVRLKQG
jgi:hypothetical protein